MQLYTHTNTPGPRPTACGYFVFVTLIGYSRADGTPDTAAPGDSSCAASHLCLAGDAVARGELVPDPVAPSTFDALSAVPLQACTALLPTNRTMVGIRRLS